jgi:hypothetical protein
MGMEGWGEDFPYSSVVDGWPGMGQDEPHQHLPHDPPSNQRPQAPPRVHCPHQVSGPEPWPQSCFHNS